MIQHIEITNDELRRLIRQRVISHAGNKKLKIYGLLSCSSGKRMKRENRVFFNSVADAVSHGYRPCGHCMPKEYNVWKNNIALE